MKQCEKNEVKDGIFSMKVWSLEKSKSLLLLSAMIFITMLIVFGRMEMNGMTYIFADIGSDTKYSYFPYYNYIVKNIQNFNFDVWSAESGLGDTIYAKSALYAEPLTMIIMLMAAVLGEQTLPILLILFKGLTIITSAIFCYKFLSLFSNRYYIITVVAYIYAFNGFSLIWGQHYFFSTYSMYNIIVIYLIERYLQKQGTYFNFPLVLVSFVVMSFTPYLAYMVYLPMILYALVRYIQLNDIFRVKPFFVKFINLGLNIVLGFLGGLVFSCGSILTIVYSGRLGVGESKISLLLGYLKQWLAPENYLSIAQRFLSGNYWGVGLYYDNTKLLDNYYEAPQLFFTIFFWLFVFQFIFTLHTLTRKNRIVSILTMLLVFVMLTNNGAKYIMYAFSNLSSRYTFVLFPLFALLFLHVMENIIYKKIYSVIGYLLAFIFSLYLLVEPYFNLNKAYLSERVQQMLIINIVLFVGGFVLLVYFSFSKKVLPSNVVIYGLAITIMMNVVVEMHIGTNRDGAVTQEEVAKIYSDEGTRNALEYLESIDDSYYRVEKTYYDCSPYTDSLMYDYKAISAYNSVLSTDIQEFNGYYMNSGYTSSGPLMPYFMLHPYDLVQYSELGVKYVLSRDALQDSEHYELINKVDDIYIYKNIFVDSFTTFFDQVVNEQEFLNQTYNNKNRLLSTAITIEENQISSLSQYATEIEDAKADYLYHDLSDCLLVDGEKITTNIPLQQGIISFSEDIKDNVTGEMFIEFSLISECAQEVLLYLDTGNGYNMLQPYRITIPANVEWQDRYILPKETRTIMVQAPSGMITITGLQLIDTSIAVKNEENVSVIIDKGKDSYIEGSIECDKNGLLLIPITYDSNWTAQVDGKDVVVYKANSSLMAIELEEGSHTFVFSYEDEFFKIGSISFVISIFLSIIYAYVSTRILSRVD